MSKRVNLFSEKRKVKKVDDKAFDMMTAVSDKTDVSIIPPKKKEISSKNIHHALMAAGMSPAYGNIADVVDATLYALEGEFGEAGWSMAAAIPVIGQMVSGKRALKAAKEAGEEMITVYRGVDKWYPARVKKGGRIMDTGETMVKKGRFVGGHRVVDADNLRDANPRLYESLSKKFDMEIFTTPRRDVANYYSGAKPGSAVLEFEVPMSWLRKNSQNALGKLRKRQLGRHEDETDLMYEVIFNQGLPKWMLKKVHKFGAGKSMSEQARLFGMAID